MGNRCSHHKASPGTDRFGGVDEPLYEDCALSHPNRAGTDWFCSRSGKRVCSFEKPGWAGVFDQITLEEPLLIQGLMKQVGDVVGGVEEKICAYS